MILKSFSVNLVTNVNTFGDGEDISNQSLV